MGQQPSTPKITAQDKAIFQLKQQRDKLKQYQKRLTNVIERQSELSRVAIRNKQPDRAKFYLRSKKQQESTISKTYDQLDNLEGLIGTIEFKLIEKDVLYGLQQGNSVLTKLNNEMSVDKIEKVLDDLEEEKIKVDEVSDALGMGSKLSNNEETEVDEEFERLNTEINGKKEEQVPELGLPEAPKNEILPEVPNNELKEDMSEQEEEISRKAIPREAILN